MGRELTIDLDGGPQAPALARQALLDADEVVPPVERPDVLLLLSEVVTNAVLHGGARGPAAVGVRVRTFDDHVCVQVTEDGGGFFPREADTDREGGFGLVLVDNLARRWGITREQGRTRVWFELPRAAGTGRGERVTRSAA